MSVELGTQIYNDLMGYTKEVSEEIRDAANKRRNEMLAAIPAVTPVRTGEMKGGWAKGTLKDNKANGQYLIGVRNKARPTVVHLVSFSHDGYAHGKKFRVVIPKDFVGVTSDYYQDMLNKDIVRILGG